MDKLKNWKFCFGLLLVTNLIFFGWFFGIRDNSVASFKNKYPLIDPSRNFISQDDFIVNLQPLRKELRDLVRWQYPRQVSLYFEFLNTGANIAINHDINIWPASFPKVPMAMAVVKKIEEGTWSFDREFQLLEQDKDSNYGSLFNSPTGTKFRLDNLLLNMLVYSDNTAYRIFLRNVSNEELDKVIFELGLEELFTEDGLVSAKEYSRLFRSLYTSSFLKRENSEIILDFLGQAKFDNFIRSGMPEEVVYSHKFGIDRAKNAYLDSGIAYVHNRPYLITVAVQGDGSPGEEEEINNFMKELGEKIYKYVTEY